MCSLQEDSGLAAKGVESDREFQWKEMPPCSSAPYCFEVS